MYKEWFESMETNAEKKEAVNTIEHLHDLSNGFDLFDVFEDGQNDALMWCTVAMLMIHITFLVKERFRLSFLVL